MGKRKNTKANTERNLEAESIQAYISKFYLGAIMLLFVLGFHDAFFDIAQSKRGIFITLSLIYVALMSFSCIFELPKIADYKVKLVDCCLLGFVISMFVSWFICFNRSESFWGTSDKCTGMIIYLLGAVVIFYLSKYLVWSVGLTWCFLISCCIVFILQIMNRYGIDPLNMYEYIDDLQRPVYLSTLGHGNYNASFNCLTVCICMVFFYLCKQRISKIVFGIMLFAGFMGSICCCSDSVYLGLLVGFVILFGYTCLNPDMWWTFWIETLLFALADLVLFFLYYMTSLRASGIDLSLREMQFEEVANMPIAFWGFASVLLCPKMIAILFGLVGVLALVIFVGLKTGLLTKFGKLIATVYGSLIGLATIGVVVYVAGHFSEQWGTYRGFIWKQVMKMFAKSDFMHKLFGYSYNTMVNDMTQIIGDSTLPDGTTIADAHNLYLNTLITSGIIGSIILAVLIVTVLVKAYKNRNVSPEKSLFVFVGICAFMVQGLVNGPQIITTPIILVELGIFINLSNKNQI